MAQSNNVITEIRKATLRMFSADEKIRIVLEGLRAQVSIPEPGMVLVFLLVFN